MNSQMIVMRFHASLRKITKSRRKKMIVAEKNFNEFNHFDVISIAI